MDKLGRNEGIRVLDDFICEAIHDPSVPQATANKRGQNEGVRVLEDASFDTVHQQSTGTVESLLASVDAIPQGSESFELFVPGSLTLRGQPVAPDVAMAIVLDRLLGKELYPNGFDERPGGRLYKYRSEQSQ